MSLFVLYNLIKVLELKAKQFVYNHCNNYANIEQGFMFCFMINNFQGLFLTENEKNLSAKFVFEVKN